MTAPLGTPEVLLRRYSRQVVLAEVGAAGQARLGEARVLVVGAGGLGSPAALYLAAAGVGTLGIVDADRVELSNLQRQILHDSKSLGVPKAVSAQGRLEALNPDVRVVAHQLRLTAAGAPALVGAYDLVVEGSDNQATKFAVNDAAVTLGRPVVVAGIVGWEGQLLTVRPGETACYRCVYRQAPPAGTVATCEGAGILGPVAGVVGSLQAVEAIKTLLGLASSAGQLLLFDGRSVELRAVTVGRDPACRACGSLPHKERTGR